MKKILKNLIIVLIFSMLLGNMGSLVYAEENYSEDYYRASSKTGDLSETERNELDKDCIKFIEKFKIDMVLLTYDRGEDDKTDLKSFADGYYEDCNFGYGDTKDGIMATFDTYKKTVQYTFYGKAIGLIPDSYADFAAKEAVKQLDKYGEFGVLYTSLIYMRDYLDDKRGQAASGKSEPVIDEPVKEEDTSKPVNTAAMPDWYPEDISKFEFFHDPDAPRVVDTADIFTDNEEKELALLIKEASAEANKDIVIFTDVSTYGLERKIYAADFYDFNGYGFGDDREGVCLMICMDPDDRGWWTCCTGPDTMELYTESIANQIEDELYYYMANGDYGSGVADWIENMKTLFIKGIPFAPDWYPDRDAEFVRIHDTNAPRASDITGDLTEEQLEYLEKRCREMSERFGYDIVVHIADNTFGMGRYGYPEEFYYYNGYGFGDNYEGIIAVLYKYSDTASIHAYGKANDKLTETNHSRLVAHSEIEDQYKAAVKFLDNIEHMEKTGRVPRTMFEWIIAAVLSLIVGAVFAAIDYLRAKAGMKTPSIAFDANNYVVRGSLYIKGVLDRYLRTTTTKTYDPEDDDSGSSSSGGGSSYSSSYSGSSGSSHTGSGRSF